VIPEEADVAVGGRAAPRPAPRAVRRGAPVDADAARVVEEDVDVVGGLAVADGLVDGGLVGGIRGVLPDQRLHGRVLVAGRAHRQRPPGDGDRPAGRIEGQVGPAHPPAVVVGLHHRGPARLAAHGHDGRRREVGVAVAPDDERDRLPGVDQLPRQGLVAVHGDAVTVPAVAVAEVAQHDDHVGGGLHLVVVVQDRVGRIPEAKAAGAAGDGEDRRLGGGHAAEGDPRPGRTRRSWARPPAGWRGASPASRRRRR
jgi:hypothetical protein